jgi:septal ring-binding cell division protein DamX
VRLVIYGGPARAPTVLHNEKVTARLGKGVAETGRLGERASAAVLAPTYGTATFGAATSVPVAFTKAAPFASYAVALGGNAAGYCWVSAKSKTGFTINCSASNSNTTDWAVSA